MKAVKRAGQRQRETRGPTTQSRRPGKVSVGVVAISSAAIVAIYGLGRANTRTAADQFRSDSPAAAASVRAGAYKDGSFTGSGTSRHGGMQVRVVIKDGKITSANVTSCSTRYPCSDVASLTRSAVANQSVPANHVSGATDSSQAYKQALTNALNQAKG